jgi:uncharacterized protein (TIGR02246 family)
MHFTCMGGHIVRAHWPWNKVLFMAAVLAAAAGGGFLAVRSTTAPVVGDERVGLAPTAVNPATAGDEKAIAKVRSAYMKAFNAGNAKALAAYWTADGEFIDAQGQSFRGRAAIQKEFAAFFAEEKGIRLEISPDSLRFVAPGVALETGTSRLTRPSGEAPSNAAYSIVHTRRDGQWKLASVREAPYAPASNYEHLRDLEWLVGKWSAKSGGKTLEFTCEWTEKRNFLIRRYSLEDADGPTHTGIQVIGWDPVLGGIRSWVFDSEGGFGSERWIRDGKRWVLEAGGVTRDGAEAESTNVLTQLDHDSFTWQSLKRSMNDVRLPDTALIKVTRVKTRK